jgi:ankyrin repeat protein
LPGDLQDRFIGHLKSVLQYPLEMKQILFSKRLELLKLASLKNKFKIIQLLEQFSCVPIDPRDDKGRTPLMLAILNNDVALVKLFLAYGSDINAKDMYQKTPLKLAQDHGYVEIQELLQLAN